MATLPCSVVAADRPNILWITSEDNGSQLGAYGDKFATTPNLDRLAERGLRYLNAWSTAPVCAPARTTIISGVYPPSTGAQHMRSMTSLPAFMQMYPQLLRKQGYYCTNNSKEDYNLRKVGTVWDDSSRKAHWRNRAAGQPFFAIFNHTVCHESKIRTRPHKQIHDPALVRVPAYHPDTPEVRQDWAQYYDIVSQMDQLVGNNLRELEDAGLAEDTIIFYYGDHGSGMPRSKRWTYNSGLNVPLIVSIPDKWKHLRPAEYEEGAATDRLVGFIDLAPTLLSLIGVEPPKWMQGAAFFGVHEAAPRMYNFGFRGRMDERYDMVRSVRDKRYIYVRNYMPHKIYGQYIAYMFKTPTTRVWRELYDAGKLEPPRTFFWETKPAEELYDLQADPDEVNNLVDSSEHRGVLLKLRAAQREWALEIRDLGFLPEGEMHSLSADQTPYELGHDPHRYPLEKIMAAAEQAAAFDDESLAAVRKALVDPESAVRYWGAMGLLIRKADDDLSQRALAKALNDDSPYVRILAAQALGQYGDASHLAEVNKVLIDAANPQLQGIYVAMLALNAIDALGNGAKSLADSIGKLPDSTPGFDRRLRNYIPNLKNKILADFE
ncbi:MAG TPA: sulfatase [Planctomycetaceae bacterium]|nr:sulfatase [Planctomycetaceae bacterium]